MGNVLDSGERRTFETGAVRDISSGKGRCDLLPLMEVAYIQDWFEESYDAPKVLKYISKFMKEKDVNHIVEALNVFINCILGIDFYTAILEVSILYEDGCVKYGERNWEKGIPLHSFVDSGIRHFLKYMRGDDDERHDRAFIWNMLAILWTVKNKPELFDI